MKKKLFITIITIIVLAFMGYSVIKKIQEKEEIAKNIEIIPQFKFIRLNGEYFSNTDIKKDIPTVFIYFNSECDFCKHERESINDNLDDFKNVNLIFISNESLKKIYLFSEEFLSKESNKLIFLQDETDSFSNKFGATAIPYTLIYDNNQHLIEAHKGQLSANGILRKIKK